MDYAHARHAGNAGDVFKHVALIAILDELLRDPLPLLYVETHAGDGLYPLGSAGEWGEGALRLWNVEAGVPGRHAPLPRRLSPPRAPPPPAPPRPPPISRAPLRPGDRLVLHEGQPPAAPRPRRSP